MARDNIDIIISSFFDGKGFKSAQAAMEKTEQRAEKMGNRLRAIQVVLASIATGAALSYAKSITKIAAEYETLIIRLSQTEGSIEQARKTYDRFRQTFGKAGFDISAAADGFQKLRVAGLGTEDAFKVVEAGANAVAAFGGSSQDLSRLIVGMTQAIGKGTLSMEEMRQQIGEAVPAAMRIQAREYGVTIGEMFRNIEKGSVDSREAMLKLAAGLEKDFGGTLELKAKTIEGALANLKSSTESSIGKLFDETTDGGAQLVAIINRLTDMMTRFIDSIDQAAMDRIMSFFNTMLDAVENIAPHVGALFAAVASGIEGLAQLIGNESVGAGAAYGLIGLALGGKKGLIGGVLAGLASQVFKGFEEQFSTAGSTLQAKMVSILGKAAVYGLVGFSILGPLGATVGAIAGVVHGIYEEFFAEADKASRNVAESTGIIGKKLGEQVEIIDKQFITMTDKAEKLRIRINEMEFTFGSKSADKIKRQIEEIIAETDRMSDKIAQAEKDGVDPAVVNAAKADLKDLMNTVIQLVNLMNSGVAAGAEKVAARVAAQARQVDAAMRGFEASVTNNKAESAMIRLDARTEGVRNQVLKLKEQYEKLGDEQGLADVNARLEKLDGLQKQGIANIGAETAATTRLNAAKYESLRLSTEKQLLDLRIQEAGTLFQGYADKAEQRRLELQQGILSTGERILQLEKEKLGATAGTRQQIELTIAKLKEFQGAQEAALASTTAAGMLAKDTWGKVAGVIEDSLKGALKDLIKGTFDAEKALLAMYDKITDAAIEYLFELIKIQLRQQLIGAAGGAIGGGGGLFGAVGGLLGGLFADGGAFKGQITPFASGGIVRGPTLFGLAGEAGDEAIMPLERIGGKLGVRAVGDGGGSFNITIQAIDTQSGAQFLQKNAQQIINQLRSADRLNRGLGSVR